MQLDTRIDLKTRRALATGWHLLPPDVQSVITDMLDGDKSADFYAGMLSGLMCAEMMREAGMSWPMLGQTIASVADMCERKELEE